MEKDKQGSSLVLLYFIPIIIVGIIGGFIIGSFLGQANKVEIQVDDVFASAIYVSAYQTEQPDLASTISVIEVVKDFVEDSTSSSDDSLVDTTQPTSEPTPTKAIVAKASNLKLDSNRKVVQFANNLSPSEKTKIEDEYNVKFTDDDPKNGVYSVVVSSSSDVEGLGEDDSVASIETDAPIFLLSETIDWGVSRVNAPEVWDYESGEGMTIAIIDTGVELTHSDLAANIVEGYDYVNNDSDPTDDNGHGTHVAGLAAAVTNDIGVAGVAHGSKIMPVKVINASGGGYLSDVAKGIYFAADNGADVINLSLGTTSDSLTLKNAVDYAANKGVIIIASAGNSNGQPCLYPAAYDAAICVGATDKDNKIASFSNTGAELVAPGVSNYSTYKNNGYAFLSGTSMAAPNVAGVAALVKADCECSAAEVRQILRETSTDLGEIGYDILFGYGLVDVLAATENPEPEPTPEPEPDPVPDTTPEPEPTPEPDTEPEPAPEKKIQQKVRFSEPKKKRTVYRSEQEEINFIFSLNPVVEGSKLTELKIMLDDENMYSTTEQEGEYSLPISELSNGQYVVRIVATFADGTKKQDRRIIDLQFADANLMFSRANPQNRENRRVKGITTIFNY